MLLISTQYYFNYTLDDSTCQLKEPEIIVNSLNKIWRLDKKTENMETIANKLCNFYLRVNIMKLLQSS